MNTIRKIPWPRVLGEGLIIVVSILLALLIQAWWEDRQRQVEERSILLSLYPEMQEKVRLVEYYETYVSALRDNYRRAYNASVSTDTPISDAEIDRHFLNVGWQVSPSIANAPVLESLVKGGDMDVVSSRELRRQLASVMALLDSYKESIARDFEFYESELLPFIRSNASLGQVYVMESHDPGHPESIYPSYNIVSPDEYTSNREAFENNEFRNLLLHRITTTTNLLAWNDSDLQTGLEALLTVLEKELEIARSGGVDYQ
jgi:hypothetical protein